MRDGEDWCEHVRIISRNNRARYRAKGGKRRWYAVFRYGFCISHSRSFSISHIRERVDELIPILRAIWSNCFRTLFCRRTVNTACFSDSSGKRRERGVLGFLKREDTSWVSQKCASSSNVLKGFIGFVIIEPPFFYTHIPGRNNIWMFLLFR